MVCISFKIGIESNSLKTTTPPGSNSKSRKTKGVGGLQTPCHLLVCVAADTAAVAAAIQKEKPKKGNPKTQNPKTTNTKQNQSQQQRTGLQAPHIRWRQL